MDLSQIGWVPWKGPVEGSRHDCYMVGQSEIHARLARKNRQWGNSLCLFGDRGYAISEEIQMPLKGINLTEAEKEFNQSIAGVRVFVEYGFIKVRTQFAGRNYREKQQTFLATKCKGLSVISNLG